MKQITYEEAKRAFLRIRNGDDDFDLVGIVLDFMHQYKPPTFDEVVKAWEEAIGDKLDFITNDEGIRVILPNKTYYLINKEQVYSNRAVFSMNVNATLYAINLTVEYLKNRQIIMSDKATK